MDPTDPRVAAVLDVPLHRFLGIRLADPNDPAAGLDLPVGEAAGNNVGVLHGGVLAAMLDVAAYLALLPHLEAGTNAVTHASSVTLVRPVPTGATVRITGELVRLGRSVAFLQSVGSSGGRTVATAQVTKSVLR